jgi:hypothetical protein
MYAVNKTKKLSHVVRYEDELKTFKEWRESGDTLCGLNAQMVKIGAPMGCNWLYTDTLCSKICVECAKLERQQACES